MRNKLVVFALLMVGLLGCYGTNIARPTPTPLLDKTPSPASYNQAGAWKLIFQDEFEGEALDKGKWTTCHWWDDGGCTIATTGELQWYLPENVLIADGTLKLRAQEQRFDAADGNTHDYTSGMVSSGRETWERDAPARFSFQYGYAEICARVPAGQGLWTAFWLLPDDHNAIPEIDVFEILGHEPDTVYLYFHYPISGPDQEDSANEVYVGPDFSAGWHTFAIDWRPEAIVWYVDGVERWRYANPEHIPAEPMYMLLNLAVGGEWPGAPDDSTPFPSFYEIDYVRVWQPSDGSTAAPTPTDTPALTTTATGPSSPASSCALTYDALLPLSVK